MSIFIWTILFLIALFYVDKNEKKLSVASLITEKNNNKNLLILNDFDSEIKKTKEMNAIIQKLQITHSLIILDKSSNDLLYFLLNKPLQGEVPVTCTLLL